MYNFNYHIFICTNKQSKRLFKLGMKLEQFDPDCSNGVIIDEHTYAIPSINKAIKFICDSCFTLQIKQIFQCNLEKFSLYNDNNCFFEGQWKEAEEAEIEALDKLLDFIENQ